MFPLTALFVSALAVNGAVIPQIRSDSSNTTLAWIGCVSDDKIATLTTVNATNAEASDSCASACLGEGDSELAYFRPDTQLCYCASGDDYPTAGDIVYAVDAFGNCRDGDDGSAGYIYSPYSLTECYLTLDGTPSSNFTTPSAITCLNTCNTTSLSIRPEYVSASDEYLYECSCFDEDVGAGKASDCGFGIEAVYTKLS